ncbi:hypothetical protein ACFLUM_00015 [Chloroflexota bacterium]
MGFVDKVRILVGALVHKPFAPKPERVDLDEGGRQKESTAQGSTAPVAEEDGLEDTDRVADLIAQRTRDEAG